MQEIEWRTHAQAASYLGVSDQVLDRMRRRGQGPRSYKIGGSRRYTVADIEAYLERAAEVPAAVRVA